MEKITSFTINHLDLEPGDYVVSVGAGGAQATSSKAPGNGGATAVWRWISATEAETNLVARGGGVWCDNCATAPLIENCLLTNNFSYYFGGALSGPAVASNCLFRANGITYAASGNGGAARHCPQPP